MPVTGPRAHTPKAGAVIVAWLALASPGGASEPPLPPVRHGNVLFSMPAGWKTETSEYAPGLLMLHREGLPRTAENPWPTVTIYIKPPRPMDRGLRGLVERDLASLKESSEAGAEIRAEAPPTTGRHPGGGEMLTARVSQGRNAPGVLRNHYLSIHVDGGEVAQTFTFVANTPELFEEHRGAFEDLVKGARLASRIPLATGPAGTKPLTLHTVYQVGDFLEWLLDVPFTEAQRDAVRTHLVRAWKRGDRGEIEGAQGVLGLRARVDALEKVKRELVRQAARAELLTQWRGAAREGDGLARAMVQVYDAAHEPLARGRDDEPPLTRQAADAALELLYFLAGQVADPDAPAAPPTQAEKDRWAGELAAGYADLPPERKQELAGMPTAWAALGLAWPELPAAQRAEMIAGWARDPVVKQVVGAVKRGRADGEARRVAEIYRGADAQRRLVEMGAYRLDRRPLYSYGR